MMVEILAECKSGGERAEITAVVKEFVSRLTASKPST
jgi:hypothetical protein